MKKDVQILIVK